MPAHSSPPRSKHLIGKTDFLFVNQPLALSAIVLRQEDYVQVDSFVLRERVEDRNPVRCNDFSNNYEPMVHATHSRYSVAS